jgi:predicted RNase H-like HicB family nuclease
VFIDPQLHSEGERRIVGEKEVAMKLRVVLEPSDEGGFTAYVPALPGCVSEGDTREEALANIREAIELYIEPVEDDISYTPNSEVIEIAV